MLRMWEETSPFHNIEYDTDDIDEETEAEVCLMQNCMQQIATLAIATI